MTAGTLTGTPVTDALAAIFADAIARRTEHHDGWCSDCAHLEDDHDGPGPAPLCGDHQADQVRADAMDELLEALRATDFDEAMLATLAIVPAGILAAITGGARDDG